MKKIQKGKLPELALVSPPFGADFTIRIETVNSTEAARSLERCTGYQLIIETKVRNLLYAIDRCTHPDILLRVEAPQQRESVFKLHISRSRGGNSASLDDPLDLTSVVTTFVEGCRSATETFESSQQP